MVDEPIQILRKRNVDEIIQIARKKKRDFGIEGLTSQVIAVFDISGSMSELFKMGVVDGLARRVAALGLDMDDNGAVPTYVFNSRCFRIPHDLTRDNLETYVFKYITQRVEGGTRYSAAIEAVMADIEAGDPALVLFFTDGENESGDNRRAEQAIREASRYPVFFQFFGIRGRGQRSQFQFLESLDTMEGRIIDNAGFSELGLLEVSDEDLIEAMLHEYKDFPSKAQAQGMLPWDPNNVPSKQPKNTTPQMRTIPRNAPPLEPAPKKSWWKRLIG